MRFLSSVETRMIEIDRSSDIYENFASWFEFLAFCLLMNLIMRSVSASIDDISV